MSPTPPFPSTSGVSSRGSVLLVLAGSALAAILFVVLPRLSESRAATSRRATPEEPQQAPAEHPRAELVQPQAVGVTDTPPAPQVDLVAASVVGARADVEKDEVKDEGPKLRYLKGNGQAKTVDENDPRISNREQRKQRRENAARGIPPEPQAKVFKTPPGGDRLTRGGQGGLVPGKGKKKKDG